MTAWTPWYKVVQVRDDILSGELSLSIFAADLYDVVMQKKNSSIYEEPASFFSLTYPTYNLRELAKDVVLRLAGKSDKAIRQLELTYGGGKTHTLITLYHLVNEPARLPNLPAVAEFISHIDITPPAARIAALTFDKLDVEKGMNTRAPNGETRWLKHPWSVLAFQLAGNEGLQLLHNDGQVEERESAPAENLLTDLLAIPQKEGLATLILMDEMLIYAHEKVLLDPAWRGRLINFFQYLTQAITRVDRCALVASLLASETRKHDQFGRELAQEFTAIFGRKQEEGIQPVGKEDVAEVLRRRFFTSDSIRDQEVFRSHVTAALHGIVELDEQSHKAHQQEESRYLKSYPFHPDMTEVFYTKWTNMESFQRTRGILRIFALAIRDAIKWDTSPLISTNIFLNAPDNPALSDAARELTNIASMEEYDGKRHEWAHILESELTKARKVQLDYRTLCHREGEQAVMAVFLHSQPIGQRAQIRDLLLLLGHTRPDMIDLRKTLQQWVHGSWFLDDETTQAQSPDSDTLSHSWRLGPEPNLNQMHHDACQHILQTEIDQHLRDQIGNLKILSNGASVAGAKVHTLPKDPGDVEDTIDFRYVILGASAASEQGKPSAEAERYLNETAGGSPRIYRNAVVIAVPSHVGVDAVQHAIRDYLGWQNVHRQVKDKDLTPNRKDKLDKALKEAKEAIPERLRHAYSIVVTISDKNEAQAFKLAPQSESLFLQIKNDDRSRINDSAVSAEALLPDGPYTIWQQNETTRRVKDLVTSFAQFPHLPKLLNRNAILDTLLQGCKEGIFVLQLARPDTSTRTFWREDPDEHTKNSGALEVTLPEHATLTVLLPNLLKPEELPDLWKTPTITFGEICAYFAGGVVVQEMVYKGNFNYEGMYTIPKAPRDVLNTAVAEAVEHGILWLTTPTASFCCESIPIEVLTDDAELQAPPIALDMKAILPNNLPQAWGTDAPEQQVITVQSIADALATTMGKRLPWSSIVAVLNNAFKAGLLVRTEDSGMWPCDVGGAQAVRIQLPQKTELDYSKKSNFPDPPHSIHDPDKKNMGDCLAKAMLNVEQMQTFAEMLGELQNIAAQYGITYYLYLEVGEVEHPTEEVVATINTLLAKVSPDFVLK